MPTTVQTETKIRMFREMCGCSQRYVGQKTGVHPTIISKIENRRLAANQDEQQKLCAFYSSLRASGGTIVPEMMFDNITRIAL